MRWITGTGFSVWVVAAILASGMATAAELSRVEIQRIAEHDVVEIHVSEEVALKLLSLSKPDRLVADFKPMRLGAGLRAFDVQGGVINRMRHGVQAGGALRLVFDLRSPVEIDVRFEKAESGGFYRIVLMPKVQPTPASGAERPPRGVQERAPEITEQPTPAVVPPTDPTPPSPAETPVSEPVSTLGAPPSQAPREATSDAAERRAEAEAAAAALIKRQMEALDRSRSAGRQAWPAVETPQAKEPGAAWRDPLAPPWE